MNTQELIRDNFQELYHAVNHPDGKRLPIVANFSGTRLYDSSSGWGRLWRWFYAIFDRLTKQDTRFEKVVQALKETHQLFLSHLPSIREAVNQYQAYLTRAGSGYGVDESHYHAIRNSITSWNTATLPFLEGGNQFTDPRVQELARVCFGKGADMASLWKNEVTSGASQLGKIIDLEGLNQSPLPLEVLNKIVLKKPLNYLDAQLLKKWVRKLNSFVSDVNLVHDALKELISRYRLNQEDEDTAPVEEVEAFLEDEGCTLFQLPDPSQVDWQKGIKSGDSIICQGQTLVVGHEVVPKNNEQERTLVFSVDLSGKVILASHNKAALGITKFRQQGTSKLGKIETAHIEAIGDDGRFAIMERLHSLESISWKSCDGILDPQESQLIDAVANMLAELTKLESTPKGPLIDLILYDNACHLKHLKPGLMEPFDFNALEDFVLAVASTNETVFQYLMERSCLICHPVAIFYHEMIKQALIGDQIPIDDLAAIYRVVDRNVVKRGTSLAKDVILLRNALFYKMRQADPDSDPSVIEKAANQKLLTEHKRTRACSLLFPSLSFQLSC